MKKLIYLIIATLFYSMSYSQGYQKLNRLDVIDSIRIYNGDTIIFKKDGIFGRTLNGKTFSIAKTGVVSPKFTTTERDALLNPSEGQIIRNSTTHTLQVFDGSVWKDIDQSAKDVAISNGGSAALAYTKRNATKDSIVLKYKDSTSFTAPLGLGDIVWDNTKKKYTGVVNIEYKLANPIVNTTTSLGVIPQMTSKTTPSPFVISSSLIYQSNTAFDSWKAFDGDSTTNWYNNDGTNPTYLRVDFGSPKILGKYFLQAKTTGGNNPVTWTIEGTNDTLVAWTVLDTRTNQTTFTAGEKRFYTFTNTLPFRWYQIRTTAPTGSTKPQIAEMQYYQVIKDTITTVFTLNDTTGSVSMPALPKLVSPQNAGRLVIDNNSLYNDTTKAIYTLKNLRNISNVVAANVYYTSDYGTGTWIVDTTDHTSIDDTATLIVAADGKRLKRLWDKVNFQLTWLNDKIGDGITDALPYWEQAKRILAGKTGIVQLPVGKILFTDNLNFYTSNVSLKGAGKTKTFITFPPNTSAGVNMAPYRTGGWEQDTSQIITYVDTAMSVGQSYLDLKVASDTVRLLAAKRAGFPIFTCAGSHYFDQMDGAFNEVDSIIGTRLYLKYGLEKDYTQSRVVYGATTLASFITPAEGGTVTISYYAAISTLQPSNNFPISVGNDLYNVVSHTSNTITIKSISNRGNVAGITIPAGTHIYRPRGIYITPSTATNCNMSDLTFTGQRTVLTLSNSYKTTLTNVTINSLPYLGAGSLVIDGDDGRFFKSIDCDYTAPFPFTTQFARSFSDALFQRCNFNQVSLQFSEMNSNVDILDCNFQMHGIAGQKNSPIYIGNTCSNVRIFHNVIVVDSCFGAISEADLQGMTNYNTHGFHIDWNTITANNCNNVFDLSSFGQNTITHNFIKGSVGRLFGSTGNVSTTILDSTYTRDGIGSGARFAWGTETEIAYNEFAGLVNGVIIVKQGQNVHDNVIRRDGALGNPISVDGTGNIITGPPYYDPTSMGRWIFKNNTFIGWNYLSNSLYLNHPLDAFVDISNNTFLNNKGIGDSRKDFVINLKDPKTASYQTTDFIPVTQNLNAEIKAYYNTVSFSSDHTLTDSTKAGVEYFFRMLYLNNLRSKITFANLHVQDAQVSLVPQIGQFKAYSAARTINLADSNYSPVTGWKGNGVDRSLTYGSVPDFFNNSTDAKGSGVFVQLGSASSGTAQGFAGNNSSGYVKRIYLDVSGVLTGYANTTIRSGMTGGVPVGGYFSGAKQNPVNGQAIQTNLASNSTLSINANTRNNAQYDLIPNSFRFVSSLSDNQGTVPENFSDASVKVLIGTQYLTQTEALILAQIVRNTDSIMGAAYQSNNPYPNLYSGNTVSTLQADGNYGLIPEYKYIEVSSAFTLTNNEETLITTANSFTVTTPAVSGILGKKYNIINTGSGTITITGSTYNGASSISLGTNHGVNIQAGVTEYKIISQY